jgi:hypothetical protein
MIKVRKDLTGMLFGRLVVLQQAEDHVKPNRKKAAKWLCRCSCGSAVFGVLQDRLIAGSTLSCGCLQKERTIEANKRHGGRETKEYEIWSSMIKRCFNKNSKSYDNYGGRGITVCDGWVSSFEAFYEDMGPCLHGMTLDRINVNSNYCKENCRWATASEQGYNKRRYVSNRSGRTGVRCLGVSGRWLASITKDNKKFHLGTFPSFEEAVTAREKAELELYRYNKE